MILGQHKEHGKEDDNKQLLIQTKNRKAKFAFKAFNQE